MCNTITKTSLQINEEDTIVLIRLINNKFRVVEFTRDVLARDLIAYFNMCDEQYLKLCTSTYIKDNML